MGCDYGHRFPALDRGAGRECEARTEAHTGYADEAGVSVLAARRMA